MNAKRGVYADTALRLDRFFGSSVRFWLNLQASYELEAAEELLGAIVLREVPPRSA